MIFNGVDIGSVESTGVDGAKYQFQFLSKDFGKLPKDGIAPGSSAFELDTGEVYIFHGETKEWYKL